MTAVVGWLIWIKLGPYIVYSIICFLKACNVICNPHDTEEEYDNDY